MKSNGASRCRDDSDPMNSLAGVKIQRRRNAADGATTEQIASKYLAS
jgi:hypothetical protein